MKIVVRVLLPLLLVLMVLGVVAAVRAGDSITHHARLLDQLDELGRILEQPERRAEEVSGWSTHDHVEHLLLANEGILETVAAGREPETVEPTTMLGRVVLLSGFIPRGQGQAPDSTVPEDLSTAEAVALLGRVRAAAEAVDPEALPEGIVGNHPVFGGFTGPDWMRLMDVHDRHHLKIVADIEAAADDSGGDAPD